jgi:hypothetical protein
VARADAKVLAILPPDVLGARSAQRGNITVSINVARKAVELVEQELGWVAGGERHFNLRLALRNGLKLLGCSWLTCFGFCQIQFFGSIICKRLPHLNPPHDFYTKTYKLQQCQI